MMGQGGRRLRVVFFGSGAFGVPSLKMLIAEHQVALVLTQPDRPAGRNKRLTATPVAQLARAAGLEVMAVDSMGDASVMEKIRAAGAEAFVVIAFGHKLPPVVLGDVFAINLHASLLPNYRGAAPINWAMINGEEETGLSVITLSQQMDGGDVLATWRTHIDARETAGELHDRMALAGPALLRNVLTRFSREGIQRGVAQDASQATRAPKLSKRDGVLDFSRHARALRQQIHGLTPWPGCTVRIGGEAVKLCRVEEVDNEAVDILAGELTDDLTIACGRGFLKLLEVQPAGGKVMDFSAYCRGRTLVAGMKCESVRG